MTMTVEPLRLTLRDYQEDALDRIGKAEARGVRRQLGVAATGLGKTIIFCALAAQRGGRTLILAHRDELVAQAAHKVTEVWPGVDVGIVKAEQNDVHAQVVVASVQTLAREKRLGQLVDAYQAESLLRPVARFDLVVVDEAHHSAADSYRNVLAALGCGEADGPLLLGVTATPDRGDGKGLDDLFDEIVFNYDVLWGIGEGYLSDVRGVKVVLDQLDLGNVKVSRGDFEAGAAGRALDDAGAPAFIVEAWRRHASDRQTLVFTPTVELAGHVAEHFQAKGVNAAMVCASTPLDERRAMLRAYAAGEIQVIANCAVLTEGFDEPRTDCIVMARPTKSRALFTQMVGRGTRRHPDKTDLLVLDVVGASDEHSLVTVPSLFGLPDEWGAGLGDGSQNLTDAVQSHLDHQVAVGRMKAEEAELFRNDRPEAIAWARVHEDDALRRYQRTMGFRGKGGVWVTLPTVVLVEKEPDVWLCGLIYPDNRKRVLLANVDLEMAQGVGEDYARKVMGRRASLISANAAWRTKPPSVASQRAAKKWRMPNVDGYATQGALSDALDAHISNIKRKRGQ